VTAEIAAGWELELAILPVTDEPLRTMVTVIDNDGVEREIGFQDYFVKRQHGVPVTAIRFDGADAARPAPGVLDALESADVIVIAPSNPLVSIGPVLAVPGVRDAVIAARERTAAISPIVSGAALKGPADRMLRELGHEVSVAGVAQLYAELADVLLIDEADAALASSVEATGLRCEVAPTIMSSPKAAAQLATVTLEAVGYALR
jgi:LPPG:FO 2-phospho-L-lactate transferase